MNDFLDMLKSVWRERFAITRREFDRALPLADYIVDRWEKAQLLGFGDGSSIYDSALVLGDVTVGRHTWIGPSTILDGSGGPLVIGDYCSISAGVHIHARYRKAIADRGQSGGRYRFYQNWFELLHRSQYSRRKRCNYRRRCRRWRK